MANNTYYANEPIIIDHKTENTVTDASMLEAVVQLRENQTSDDADHEFSMGAMWEETVSFDVSTAFRAALRKSGHYDLSPRAYTINSKDKYFYGGDKDNDKVELYITKGDRYLLNGDSTPNMGTSSDAYTAWRGGRSDSERFYGKDLGPVVPVAYSGTSTYKVGDYVIQSDSLYKCKTAVTTAESTFVDSHWTMVYTAWQNGDAVPQSAKPTDEWETVNKGDEVRCGKWCTKTSSSNTTDTLGSKSCMSRKIYVEDNPLRYQFMIENHLGFIESASCLMRENKSYKITSEDRYRTYAPSLDVKSSLYSKKSGDRAVWKMSSGYVTRDWAEWYANEFLMSPKHWLWINNSWLPVSVVPDSDTTTIYDESKGELTAINFTVTSGIKGRI